MGAMKSFWEDGKEGERARCLGREGGRKEGRVQRAAVPGLRLRGTRRGPMGFKREIGMQNGVSYRERTANK